MSIPSSGTVTFSDLQTTFGGSNPIGINEYYRNGGLVPDNASTANVPTSGQISLTNFYGAGPSNTYSYTGATQRTLGNEVALIYTGSGTFRPDQNMTVRVYCVAGGGGGGGDQGAGGGGGGYLGNDIPLIGGTTYSCTIGAAGTANSDARGGNGGNTVFSGGSITATALGGGGGGGNPNNAGNSGGSGGGGAFGSSGGAGTQSAQTGYSYGIGNNGGSPWSDPVCCGGGGSGSAGYAGTDGGGNASRGGDGTLIGGPSTVLAQWYAMSAGGGGGYSGIAGGVSNGGSVYINGTYYFVGGFGSHGTSPSSITVDGTVVNIYGSGGGGGSWKKGDTTPNRWGSVGRPGICILTFTV